MKNFKHEFRSHTDRWTATFCGQPLASALASLSGGGGDSGGGLCLHKFCRFPRKKIEDHRERNAAESFPVKLEVSTSSLFDDLRWRNLLLEFSYS